MNMPKRFQAGSSMWVALLLVGSIYVTYAGSDKMSPSKILGRRCATKFQKLLRTLRTLPQCSSNEEELEYHHDT